MESFSLLKYWRGGGSSAGFINGGGGGSGENGDGLCSNTTTTIVTAVSHQAAETKDDDDDDGPFFDLEFAVEEEEYGDKNDRTNNEEEDRENQNDDVSSKNDGTDEEGEEEEEGEEDREFNFTISSNSSGNDCSDPNLTLSRSDDLFFKGRLVPIKPSSLVFNPTQPNSKPPQFPVSLLKSATKFRVAMLGLTKSKQNASEKTEPDKAPVAAAGAIPDNTTPKQQQAQKQETEKEKKSKFFTVKFKVEEIPIVSLVTRDSNSSRKSEKQSDEDSAASEEKKFSKDVMQKYLKKVKPLYIRVSKRYAEKLKFPGQLSLGSGAKTVQSTPPAAGEKTSPSKATAGKCPSETDVGETQDTKSQKQANIPERLRIVCKHLGKSRSASSAVAAAPSQPTISRRDDSLLQQQDGIQSAILHCKKSLNASRDTESSILPRSVSDPSHQQSAIDLSRKSPDGGKK